MAENQEDRQTDDLSEEPSQHRIDEQRRKGNVAQSRELSGMLGLLVTGTALYLWSPTIAEELATLMKKVFTVDYVSRLNLSDTRALFNFFGGVLKSALYMALPIGVLGFIISLLGSYIQVGNIFSTEPITPNLNKINPVSGLKRYFSLKKVFDGIRLVIRASVVAFIAYFLVKDQIVNSPQFVLNDPGGIIGAYGFSARWIFWSLLAVLIIFAGFDFWIQKWEYGKQIRVTKQEAKQEHKEHEGDPLIKARIRSVQKEAARRRMMDAVKTADVVVTNPTHLAVALKYDRLKMDAPRVIAKGADFIAQKIKKIAADSDVPLVENVPLARALYRQVKIGQIVPRALYQAVAEVLAFIYKLKKKTFGLEIDTPPSERSDN